MKSLQQYLKVYHNGRQKKSAAAQRALLCVTALTETRACEKRPLFIQANDVIRVVDDEFSIFRIAIVFKVQGIAFQTAAPADDDRAFPAQLLQHGDGVEVQDRCEQKFHVINHDDTGIEAVDCCRYQGNGLIRAVGTRNFQKFIVKEFPGFTDFP